MIDRKEIPQNEYRESRHISASDIKLILENPYLFKIGYKKPKTDSMLLGSLVHTLVIEPENFERDYYLTESFNLRTQAGKSLREKALQESNGKIIIQEDFYIKAKEIARTLLESDLSNLFKNGAGEHSFFGEINGIPCKCRPDYFLEVDNQKIIIDLKTTKFGGASPDNFVKSIASFGYYIQAAFYLELLKADEFIFVAIETEPPYMMGIYELDNISLEFGLSEVKRGLDIYRNIDKIENIYKDNSFKKKQILTLPNYVYYKKDSKI